MKDVLTVIDTQNISFEPKEGEYGTEQNEEDIEDTIRQNMMKRGPQQNLSFFAFTATPKAKTLEVFGQKGIPPLHLENMQVAQAV